MLDLLSPRMQQRLLILADYIQALSQGDLETTNSVLVAAENDEVLARMILEVNALSQEDQQKELQPEEQALINRLLDGDAPVPQEIGSLDRLATNVPRSNGSRRLLPVGNKRRSRPVRAFLGSVAAVLLVSLLVGSFLLVLAQSHHPGTGVAGSSHRSSSGPSWRTVPLPGIIGKSNWGDGILQALVATSQDDAWAVGTNVILHWNGQHWLVVPGAVSTSNFKLSGVAATSANDVWAVGEYEDSSAPGKGIKPLLEHWNGHRWSLVPSGNVPAQGELYSVAALSSNNVWVTGDSLDAQDQPHALVLHWDGQQWSVVPHPERTGTFDVALNAITALAPNDIWIVGSDSYAHQSQYQANVIETLIEHWDGTSWKIVSSPTDGLNDSLTSITAASPQDIWAAGSTDGGVSNNGANAGGPIASEGQIEHWDGKSWKIVQQTAVPAALSEIAAISSHDVWAVGALSNSQGVATSGLEHWDGQHWGSVSFPNAGRSALSLVAPIPGTNKVWVAWATSQVILMGSA